MNQHVIYWHRREIVIWTEICLLWCLAVIALIVQL